MAPSHSDIRRVAIVGTGTIGAGWLALVVAHGYEVAAFDPAPAAEAKLGARLPALRADLAACGLTPAGEGRWSFAKSLADGVAGADFVQESAAEDLELKTRLFAEIDAAAPAGAIVATSTSALKVSDLQKAMRHPERCVLGHPFNPSHLMPLVEVVGGTATDAAVVDKASAFYRRLGKQVVTMRREIDGHVANRLMAAAWREAIHLVAEGVVSTQGVDDAFRFGPGPKWSLQGPFLSYHLGADGGMAAFLEHFAPMFTRLWGDLGRPALTPDVMRRLVEGVAEETGSKSVEALRRERDARLLRLLPAIVPEG